MATQSPWSGRPLSQPGPNSAAAQSPRPTVRARNRENRDRSRPCRPPHSPVEAKRPTAWNRRAGTALLWKRGASSLALLLVAGIIVYFSWPYSQDELYRKAEALMASPKRSDWHGPAMSTLTSLTNGFPITLSASRSKNGATRSLLEDAEHRASSWPVPERPNLERAGQRAERSVQDRQCGGGRGIGSRR